MYSHEQAQQIEERIESVFLFSKVTFISCLNFAKEAIEQKIGRQDKIKKLEEYNTCC